MSTKHDALIEAAKAAPPVSVAGMSIAQVPLADWALIATLIYTVILIIDKLPVLVARARQFVAWLRGTK